MARRPNDASGDDLHRADVLYIIPSDDDAGERFFFSDEEADAATTPEMIARALSLAGAWSDLDWAETEAALHRIRHESVPTPPITGLG